MVQPYQPAVDNEGEAGLIFLGGAFSHAMHKDPMIRRGVGPAGQPDRQPGRHARLGVAGPARRWAGRAVAAAERLLGPTTYARVDTVRRRDGRPGLLELELLDPVLFFTHHPDGVAAAVRSPGSSRA